MKVCHVRYCPNESPSLRLSRFADKDCRTSACVTLCEHRRQIPSLSSRLDPKAKSVNIIEKIIDDMKSEFDIHEDSYGNILVAVTEAVNNAIIHGKQSGLSSFHFANSLKSY